MTARRGGMANDGSGGPARRTGWAALLVMAALAAGGCGGTQPATPAPVVTADGRQRIEVAFADGAVVGGPVRHAVPVGSEVELVVASDVTDEVHVHGYDRKSFVTAGATTTLRFRADLPGVFEVELEQQEAPLTELEVS